MFTPEVVLPAATVMAVAPVPGGLADVPPPLGGVTIPPELLLFLLLLPPPQPSEARTRRMARVAAQGDFTNSP
jgi:hypothetical protein